ncbi:MAG TPA: amidohydrolase family protein [Chloroflexota bacterium]|nr:amidohydrolase family protein [Chloroflexota bacterium]
MVIDADTHVDECEATWEYLDGDCRKFAPVTVMPTEAAPDGPNAGRGRWWLVGGQMVPRAIRDDAHHPPRTAREMHDVAVRLRDMDRLGVDVQVIFPTFFIRYGASDPVAEAALASAYNRWLADRCAPSGGRLRWVAQVPMLDAKRSVEELRWAKDNGACGVYKRGYDLEKPVTDPCFFPIYEEASALDLPICIHTGHPLPGREWDRGFPLMASFIGLITAGIPDLFPRLRFGFIEAGASWIPYCLSQLGMQRRSQALHERAQTFELKQDLFRANRLFVAIDPVDDIEYLVRLDAEDNLMIGTDYCHGDISANLQALGEVRRWVEDGRISETVATKLLETNPRAFYGF